MKNLKIQNYINLIQNYLFIILNTNILNNLFLIYNHNLDILYFPILFYLNHKIYMN